jgi:toxoflavin biosynthesis protein ToxD
LSVYRNERTQERDARLWSMLTGADTESREESARTICALELEEHFARELLEAIRSSTPLQRAVAGEALSLLGDIRFSPPYFLSEMLPVHFETTSFALAQMSVTHAAYEVFVHATRHRAPRGWRHGKPPSHLRNAPVTWISAHDAEAYCRWLSDETGFAFRLPSEQEWLLAARGGELTRQYPWGSSFDQECANVWGRAASRRICAVGLFPEGAGPYGHLDLIGNVWEWCSPNIADARDSSRVMVGGSWRSKPGAVTGAAARQSAPPADSYEVAGFRLARDSHV